ncbi:MAG: ATPase (AAA+ superfamily)-like protein [Comamonadaceae bacterium]|nr:MAG: ATPase (AAA+ superfamily)-like protein [Comamonadaceae bacterium]
MNSFPRDMSSALQRLARQFPVLAITGPRQSGKTTLARQEFPGKPYVSLEDPIELSFAQADPRGFLQRFAQGAIFDEAQRWPELFSHLQGLVDTDRAPGRFVLTGSQQFGLMAGVTQSLAGRVGLARLLPLALSEITLASTGDLHTHLWRGAYPALWQTERTAMEANDWLGAYVSTYVERDVRQLLQVQNLSTFQRFVRLCAARTGTLLNLVSLATDTGISHSTARQWLSVLESSELLFLLPPYHRNFGKRLVKTPKLYFTDTGLAAWLIGIRDPALLALHPMRGELFETWVINEFRKFRLNQGLSADLYFWRDNNGLEADLVFETEAGLQCVEIKSSQTITPDLVRAGQRAARFVNEPAPAPWLIHGAPESYTREGVRCISWQRFADPQKVLPA